MKRIAGALVVMMMSLSAAYAAPPKVYMFHLTGDVYVAVDSEYAKVNCAVYIGTSSVTVVGATWSPEAAALLAGEIGKVTDRPIAEVINTDYNPEYAGGNAYWKSIGARIVSTKLTYDLLKRNWDTVGNFIRKYYPDYPHIPLVLPTVTYPGDFELQGGRVRAIYLGPSHTPDDIFVYFPREKVLYAGSILKEHLGNMAFAHVGEYEKTLLKLKDLHLDIRTIISGHWSAVHGPELIDRYLTMLEEYSRNSK